MEGFHLFQEKIKGEVNTTRSKDPSYLFLQAETLSGWDISELGSTPSGELKYIQPFEYELEEAEYELAPFVNCSIEYSTLHQSIQVQLEDGRDALMNFNNDLGMEGRYTIMMFYN